MKVKLKDLIDAFPAADRATKAADAALKALLAERRRLSDAIYAAAKPDHYLHFRAADGSVVIVGKRRINSGDYIPSVYVADVTVP